MTQRYTWLTSRLDRWRLFLFAYAIAYALLLTVNLGYMSMEWDEVTHFTGGLLLSRGQIGQWIWTNSFYPPAYDLATAGFYLVGGASVFTARLVTVAFSALSLFAIYEVASRLYNPKTALVAAVLFSVTPGIVWLSRMAMIETMLIFIFTTTMLFFFSWLQTGKEKYRILSVAALVVGVTVKYQMIVVVPLIMLLGMYFWKKDYLKTEAKRYMRLPLLAVIAAAFATLAVAAYLLLNSGLADTLVYAIQVGTGDRAIYSARYPMPVYYFAEMAFSNSVHPVSLLLYFAGLAGLGFLVYRRRREDKFLLLWFAAVYVVFTLIPNREWRYVTIAFPVLAIAAASLFTSAFGRLWKIGQTAKRQIFRSGTKIAAASLVVFLAAGVYYSCVDAYTWVAQDQIQLPIEAATNFAAQGLDVNQTLMVACPLNRFNKYMVWFYLNQKAASPNQNQTLQYPLQAVDGFTPNFNMTEFIGLCEKHNVKDVLLYECGANFQYFNSTLTSQKVWGMLNETRQFTLQAEFGAAPERIFVFSYNKTV